MTKLTLDDIRAKMYGDTDTDPIASSPDEVADNGSMIQFAGIDDGKTYRDSLRIVPEGDGVRLYVREPGKMMAEDWKDHGYFDDFDQLHGWIYEL